MRRHPDAFDFVLLLGAKVISEVLKQAVLEADKHPKSILKASQKYPDAIDVEYRVIDDGK